MTTANLRGSIEVELSLPESDRKSSGSKFTELARKELERLQSTSPDIPLKFVKQFDKRFRTKWDCDARDTKDKQSPDLQGRSR